MGRLHGKALHGRHHVVEQFGVILTGKTEVADDVIEECARPWNNRFGSGSASAQEPGVTPMIDVTDSTRHTEVEHAQTLVRGGKAGQGREAPRGARYACSHGTAGSEPGCRAGGLSGRSIGGSKAV